MSLSDDEVDALLAIAMSYDNRRLAKAHRMAWSEAAHRGRWTFDAAVEAIHEHYATKTEFLMPGHITAAVREYMRRPIPVSELLALEAAQPAAEETRSRIREMLGDKFGMSSRRQERAAERLRRRPAGDPEARERARQELAKVQPAEPPEDAA